MQQPTNQPGAPSVEKAMGLCLVPLAQVPGQSAPLLLSDAEGGGGAGTSERDAHTLAQAVRAPRPAATSPAKAELPLTVPRGARSLTGGRKEAAGKG